MTKSFSAQSVFSSTPNKSMKLSTVLPKVSTQQTLNFSYRHEKDGLGNGVRG
jgi:predicted DNA-binding transcriptional regulator YafY